MGRLARSPIRRAPSAYGYDAVDRLDPESSSPAACAPRSHTATTRSIARPLQDGNGVADETTRLRLRPREPPHVHCLSRSDHDARVRRGGAPDAQDCCPTASCRRSPTTMPTACSRSATQAGQHRHREHRSATPTTRNGRRVTETKSAVLVPDTAFTAQPTTRPTGWSASRSRRARANLRARLRRQRQPR